MNAQSIQDAFGDEPSDVELPGDPGSPRISEPFGAALAPVLVDVCDGRLSELHWFRTDWQRGGALTGYAQWRTDDGRSESVVVKMPVPPRERLFLDVLQDADGVVPKLYADGEMLGGYDICWLVMERLPHGPIDGRWGPASVDLLIDAACRCYKALESVRVEVAAKTVHWDKVLKRCRDVVRENDGMPLASRWKAALKTAQKKLPGWLKRWESRDTGMWCHGDLHLGNAMTRQPAPHGPAVLLDFALTHAGHWVEDAVFLERLYWHRREALDGRKLCRQMAHERKRYGLTVEQDWVELAQVRRALVAMSAPAFLNIDRDPSYQQACLEVLESEL